MDVITERFKNRAILRGGMVLRILGSQRLTNDLDYIFIPYKSKNEIVQELLDSLKVFKDAEIKHYLNSKNLKIQLKINGITVQIEAKVGKEIKSIQVTTQLLAEQYDLPKRAILIVDHSISMANKLAAWNERRLSRDLYDIWFFVQMNIQPDIPTLEKRLKKIEYSKNINKTSYFNGKTIPEFYEFLRKEVSNKKETQIVEELSDYIERELLIGIKTYFMAAFVKLK